MKIAVHAKALSEKQLHNGIVVYTYNILKAISEIDNKNQYILYSNKPIIQKIKKENFKEKILRFPKFWSYLRFPFEFNKKNNYDILFVAKEQIPPFIRPKTVIVCYDLYFKNSRLISFNGKIHFWLAVNYALKKADKIITISESTKRAIVKDAGINQDKIVVIPLGYDKDIYKPCTDVALMNSIKEKYGINKDYFINTSSLLWYRKNIDGIIKAFHICKTRGLIKHQLIITGKRGEAYENIINLIKSLNLEKDIILTGCVPIEDLPVLLSGAVALIFPSFHEGFGLPIVEAMACGCPVITSNTAAMPEVAGDAGILVNPYSVEEIAQSIEVILSNIKLRNKMRDMGFKRVERFSWEKTAMDTLNVFKNVYDN